MEQSRDADDAPFTRTAGEPYQAESRSTAWLMLNVAAGIRRWRMLGHWGLQKRIMAYVAVGLFIGFAAFFFVGMRAVKRSTQFVFDERLAIAEKVAAELSDEIDEVARDTEERLVDLAPHSGRASFEDTLDGARRHFALVDRFAFFDVTSLWLVDATGGLLAETPEGSYRAEDSLVRTAGTFPAVPRTVWPERPHDEILFSTIVPLGGGPAGAGWAYAVVNVKGRDVRDPFISVGLADARNDNEGLSQLSLYHLEVLDPSGKVVVGFGPDENAGRQSPHYLAIRDWMAARSRGALLHTAPGVNEGRSHIMAAVPVAAYPLYVVLEQDQDVALAVATDFRTQLFLFSTFGFLGVLVVAWVTTRHVVRPTELLTAAAERMASGELSTPIDVAAQDEIGVLARSLEVMRQQLEHALSEVEAANRELESRVRDRTAQLQKLVGRVLTAQEDERRRVALELHDETAQALTALTMALDSVARGGARLPPEDAETLHEARQMAATTLAGVRRLIQALGPASLEHMGVAAALRSYADEFLGRFGGDLHVEVQGPRDRLPQHVELALYRIGQEALNNAVRHARAKHVRAALSRDSSRVTLTVADDGSGFDPLDASGTGSRARGLGIAGMHERARAVGGEVTIESAPGRGTNVTVEIPIASDE